MLYSIEASSPVPIYEQIVGQVRAAVAGGELRTGDPLPSVRQLAAELRVNPNTVAQAYRELEREGLTYVLRGQGTFVAAVDAARRAEERERVARELAARVLGEAARLGISPSELRAALDEAAEPTPAAEPVR